MCRWVLSTIHKCLPKRIDKWVAVNFSIFKCLLTQLNRYIDGEPCIVNADCVEPDSSCTRYVCTATVGTQTTSQKNAAVQTTQSLESLSDSHVQLDKSSSFSNRRIRNYFKYTKLDNSDGTKFSSLDEESTLCKMMQVNFICNGLSNFYLFTVGESCDSENKPCPGLKYSMCRRGFCQCQDGFYEKNEICKAELGELVEEVAFCGSGLFKNSKCVCRNDDFYLPSMRACIKCKRLKLC